MASIVSSPNALALAQIARGNLTLQTTAAGTYDSYFLGSPTNDPDYYFSVQPLLQYTRNAGLISISADAGVSFVRYLDNTQYNSNDLIGGIHLTLPTQEGSRLDGSLGINYVESTQIDYFVDDRIPTRTLSGRLAFNYKLGLKTSLSEAFDYTKLMRDSANYSDQQVWSNDLIFRYDDFLYGSTLSLDYNYTNTSSSGNNSIGVPLDQQDNAFSLGLTRPIYDTIKGSFSYGYHFFKRGENETANHQTESSGSYFTLGIDGPFLPPRMFPKLTSSLALYYRDSSSVGINYGGGKTLTGQLSLSWAARERTDLAFTANRTTELNASDYSVTNSRVGFTVTERVGNATTLTGGLNYRWSQYKGIDRTDGFFGASIGARYVLNKNWSANADYQYQQNRNNSTGFQPTPEQGRDYTRQVVTLAIVNTF